MHSWYLVSRICVLSGGVTSLESVLLRPGGTAVFCQWEGSINASFVHIAVPDKVAEPSLKKHPGDWITQPTNKEEPQK